MYKFSEESFLLSEIAGSNCRWPLPCIVEDGYLGETLWDTVGSGETILLSALEKRRRVLAHSISEQNYYSIPHDCPLRFSVVDLLPNQKETTPKLISEILLKHQLPVTIKFRKGYSVFHNIRGRKVLPTDQMVVVDTYNEKYVMGNCIINGALQNEILLLPTFLKIRVRLIKGIEGWSKTEWKVVQKTWKEKSQENTKTIKLPPLDIVVFESLPSSDQKSSGQKQKASEIYEALVPSAYISLNFNSERSEGDEYEEISETCLLSGYEDLPKYDNAVSTPDPRQNTNSRARIKFNSELHDPPVTHKSSSDSLAKPTSRVGHDIPTPTGIAAARQPSLRSQGKPSPKPLPSSRPSPNPPVEADTYETIDYIDVSRGCEMDPRTNSRIRSLKDVPTSVKSLNCDEIADCLRLLKLSKYAEQFIANQIDGSLLEELQESILTEELQMTHMHAKKLIMFAQKGWRPT